MKEFFGYVRVSTAKQGEKGVSLQEQRDAILRHAQRNELKISEWFEERITAAKRGRPIFNKMLRLLKRSKANGVIIHKIDRSARNLKDWADLGELIDKGIEVHFANESLDLHSRGGRLSADIQAVVAADYIRNLREETRKGFYGRLKQGVYPLPAPLGYIDMGKGKPKEPDPARAPFVRKAFELYASGRHNLESLTEELFRLGLRNRKGNKVSLNGISVILNNPFYIGLIRIRRTSETFAGGHEPLIAKSLFDRVQCLLRGKTHTKTQRHDFLFRRMLICKHCGRALRCEKQKGHVYYRCHTKDCPMKCVREEIVEQAVLETLSQIQLSDEEVAYLKQQIPHLKENWVKQREGEIDGLKLRLSQIQDRLQRLTDAYIDRLIEKELFEERKASLLGERKDLEEKISQLEGIGMNFPDRLAELVELLESAYLRYEMGFPEEKRDLLKILTSNREVDEKTVYLRLSNPFDVIANRSQNSYSPPYRDIGRTNNRLLQTLIVFTKAEQTQETRIN